LSKCRVLQVLLNVTFALRFEVLVRYKVLMQEVESDNSQKSGKKWKVAKNGNSQELHTFKNSNILIYLSDQVCLFQIWIKNNVNTRLNCTYAKYEKNWDIGHF